MRTTLHAAAGVALASLLHSSSVAQQPNLFIYGNFEEPYSNCAPAPTGTVPLIGTGCYDVQKWPTCGGRWWAWQRQIGTTVTGGAQPIASVFSGVPGQIVPVPVSGSRMVRYYTNANCPLGTYTMVIYQRLSTPLTAGSSYFMRWRFKAIKNPNSDHKFKFEVVHGNDNGVPCTPVPGPSAADYPMLPALMSYENQTPNLVFLDGQSAFTFTALGGENYVALRTTIQKGQPLVSASSLWLDDFELYDASLPIPPAMMAEGGNGVSALRMVDGFVESPSFTAMPNPTAGSVSVITAGIPTNTPLLVLASDGRVVRSLRTNDEARLDIDLTQEPAGLYTIRISDGDRNEVVRVVKE
ncbi:MAG: T9SS type A sorting domain-containing protein [Flavobacteriales bacterium]|nr:T9SS type A sorting domain-containing protein [Flavobacteriales bacterium]